MSAASAMQTESAGNFSSALRILVVDDDSDDRELVADLLHEGLTDPYQVELTDCLGEGMQELQRCLYDVALLDLQLPDAGHTQSVEDFRRLRPDLAIIALSGQYAEPEILDRCLQAGAQDFLSKSELTPILLSRAIGSALFAVREMQIGELERSLKHLQRMTSDAAGTQQASILAGVGSMKSRLPIVFQTLVVQYHNMFKEYSRYQALRSKKPVVEMRQIVEQLGLHNAGPRDVMDLHMEGVPLNPESGTGRERLGGLGRLLVLELLGMLASFYRDIRLGVSQC